MILHRSGRLEVGEVVCHAQQFVVVGPQVGFLFGGGRSVGAVASAVQRLAIGGQALDYIGFILRRCQLQGGAGVAQVGQLVHLATLGGGFRVGPVEDDFIEAGVGLISQGQADTFQGLVELEFGLGGVLVLLLTVFILDRHFGERLLRAVAKVQGLDAIAGFGLLIGQGPALEHLANRLDFQLQPGRIVEEQLLELPRCALEVGQCRLQFGGGEGHERLLIVQLFLFAWRGGGRADFQAHAFEHGDAVDAVAHIEDQVIQAFFCFWQRQVPDAIHTALIELRFAVFGTVKQAVGGAAVQQVISGTANHGDHDQGAGQQFGSGQGCFHCSRTRWRAGARLAGTDTRGCIAGE